jgi:hypothetical protein
VLLEDAMHLYGFDPFGEWNEMTDEVAASFALSDCEQARLAGRPIQLFVDTLQTSSASTNTDATYNRRTTLCCRTDCIPPCSGVKVSRLSHVLCHF